MLVLRAVDGQRTLGAALAELAVFLLTSAVLTWRLERELLREVAQQLRPLPEPVAAG